MVRKEPLENIALGALLVGLLCRGLKESKQKGRVEQSRLEGPPWGLLSVAARGGERTARERVPGSRR